MNALKNSQRSPRPSGAPYGTKKPSPEDAEYERRHAHRAIASDVYDQQTRTFLNCETIQATSLEYVEDIVERLECRDPLEEMLALQALWTHARLARLSILANRQTDADSMKIVNDACDRAANTFRRYVLAMAEYRRPPRTDAFVAIGQANVAQQQVVNNGPEQIFESPNSSNEKGLSGIDAQGTEALPAHSVGTGIPSGVHRESETLATD
jgi:hypothetical protein